MEDALLFNGTSMEVFKSEDPDTILVRYTDTISAFNGIKKATIAGKGEINASIAAMIAGYLSENGIYNRFIRKISSDRLLCAKTEPIDLEVTVRNFLAGSMAQRLGLKEGTRPENTIFDLCYKNAELGNPFINDHYAVALGLVSYKELDEIYSVSKKINVILRPMLESVGIQLVDLKLEFGRDRKGSIILAGEITPDTARMWDIKTSDKLDKDRYRRDMGKIYESYRTVNRRLAEKLIK